MVYYTCISPLKLTEIANRIQNGIFSTLTLPNFEIHLLNKNPVELPSAYIHVQHNDFRDVKLENTELEHADALREERRSNIHKRTACKDEEQPMKMRRSYQLS
jgi:hypothetical protein